MNGNRSAGRVEAVLFDLDGVITDTAAAHFAAWKALFDAYLPERGDPAPFTQEEYRRLVDGKPRYDGVASVLAARGITPPAGEPGDGPEAETVCGLGNRKNRLFTDWLAANRVEVYPGSLALLDRLRATGLRVGVFSSSRNARAVLASAGILERFAARVDGEEGADLGLPGKPDPAYLLECARRLGTVPARAAVIEDARAGIEAGAAGGFAQVIAVDREGEEELLRAAGAHLVVADLAELDLGADGTLAARTLGSLPSAFAAAPTLRGRLSSRRAAVFLDYDGTLSPIVQNPADAVLGAGMRAALAALAERLPVAIVSGRDLDDVRGFVADDTLYFAGSHGFDLAGPDGWRVVIEKGQAFLPALAAAADALEAALAAIPGARIERKRFAIAVHFRQVEEADEACLAETLRAVMEEHPRLKASAGKKVYDIKPRTDWNKGRAVLALLDKLDLNRPDVLPIYLGDDTTDEDAFRALADRGIGVVVRGGDEDRRTSAQYALDGTEEVERFLRWLAAERAETEG